MIGFEQAIINMSERGEASACTPAAFKAAGIEVAKQHFIVAALQGKMNPEDLARELGLISIQKPNLNLNKLYSQLDELKEQGLYIFVRIGAPSHLGVIGQHLNSVVGRTTIDDSPALRLGGIAPFGKKHGYEFKITTLQRLIPSKEGILLYKKD